MRDILVAVLGMIFIGMEIRFGWKLADLFLYLMRDGLATWQNLFKRFCAWLNAKRKNK